jgi:uncharacterized protein (TIGR01777 family)
MARRIFVTGGTGFIGRALVASLIERGDTPIVVTRNAARARARLGEGVEIVEGDPTFAGPWQEKLAGTDAVVNLAGQPIADKRWSAHYKQILHDSRVDTTRFVVEGIGALDPKDRPAVLVSASGVDYYGADEDAVVLDDEDDQEAAAAASVDESAPRGESFMARLCRDWEREAREARRYDVRVVRLRTGIVLATEGPLRRMAAPFKWFVGGRLGNGRQWVSWIHLDDVLGAIEHCIATEDLAGPVNVVAPNPVRNRAFSRALGKALGRPSFIPAPAFAIKLLVGEFAGAILSGRRAVPKALLDSGYQFQHPDLEGALAAVYGS